MAAMHLHPGTQSIMTERLADAQRLLGELRKSTTAPRATDLALRPDEARIMDEVRPPSLEEAVPGVAVLRQAGVPLLTR